jgi:hypothetical protein
MMSLLDGGVIGFDRRYELAREIELIEEDLRRSLDRAWVIYEPGVRGYLDAYARQEGEHVVDQTFRWSARNGLIQRSSGRTIRGWSFRQGTLFVKFGEGVLEQVDPVPFRRIALISDKVRIASVPVINVYGTWTGWLRHEIAQQEFGELKVVTRSTPW